MNVSMIPYKSIIIITIHILSCVGCQPQSTEKEKIKIESNDEKTFSSCETLESGSINEKANAIKLYFRKIQNAESNEIDKFETLFFCAFPSSFKQMEQLFGFDGKNGVAPLYSEGHEIIYYFHKMNRISPDKYYNKYIDICIHGHWQADNIRQAFGFAYKIIDDPERICLQLSIRSDDEIKSVFRFVFDGPHPVNDFNKELYERLINKLADRNKRISRLMTEAYEESMERDHSH